VAHDALVVRHAVVVLDAHAARGELVDRGLDVVDREVQDRVRRRLVVGLRVDQRRAVARDVQREQAVRLVDLDPQRLAVELPGGVDVVDREPAAT
jgi:hypothetical protein